MGACSPLSAALLSRVTDATIEEARGFREDPVGALPESALESSQLPDDWRSTISSAAYDFIVRWETGGKAYYERVIKGRPIWPGFASGITIGCGFDLGYHKLTEYTAEWKSRLGGADFERLAGTLGFRTVAPDRDEKVRRAKALVQSLSDIAVPWNVAIEQFDNAKLPSLIKQLYTALDHLDLIHPHCRGALLSLVFNRGPAFTAAGDRYVEMRAVGTAMQSGSPTSLAQVPALLRAMKRIWGESSGLAERREGEAKLFEAGLAEMHLVESFAGVPGGAVESAPLANKLVEMHAVEDVEQSDQADVEESGDFETLESAELEAAGLSPASVRWNSKDDEEPDYRHLDTSLTGSTFEFSPTDLNLLIAANEFAIRPGKIIFALRGAALMGNRSQLDVPAIVVTDQRPDHRNFRCIIGVCDRTNGTLSAFPASTVPNAFYVHKCFAQAQAGVPIGNLTGNILPTGCYTYALGTHKKGQKGEIPGVLRLSLTADGASPVVVLRSLSDVVYDRFDRWLIATPADNIHPAILSNGFSSAGCLTIPGSFVAGQHQGLWAEFRRAAGMDTAANGTQFSTVLVTGLEAAAAARVRRDGREAESLSRLRHGSKGARVAALQAALRLDPDASQLMGPVTRLALAEKQTMVLGWADGIYSPAMDQLLGFKIYAVS